MDSVVMLSNEENSVSSNRKEYDFISEAEEMGQGEPKRKNLAILPDAEQTEELHYYFDSCIEHPLIDVTLQRWLTKMEVKLLLDDMVTIVEERSKEIPSPPHSAPVSGYLTPEFSFLVLNSSDFGNPLLLYAQCRLRSCLLFLGIAFFGLLLAVLDQSYQRRVLSNSMVHSSSKRYESDHKLPNKSFKTTAMLNLFSTTTPQSQFPERYSLPKLVPVHRSQLFVSLPGNGNNFHPSEVEETLPYSSMLLDFTNIVSKLFSINAYSASRKVQQRNIVLSRQMKSVASRIYRGFRQLKTGVQKSVSKHFQSVYGKAHNRFSPIISHTKLFCRENASFVAFVLLLSSIMQITLMMKLVAIVGKIQESGILIPFFFLFLFFSF
jgi:hypothetical protein